MNFISQVTVRNTVFALSAFAMSACASLQATDKSDAPGPSAALATQQPADIASYFDLLDRMAPGDPVRQAAELTAALDQAQQHPTSSNRLRYAIALGAAGHAQSNPVEAGRQITGLLAGPHDLAPQEVTLANALQREFDARVELSADLARLREESEQQLKTIDADGDRRYSALNAETQRLKKALAEAERKLEAVAEMERSLTPEGQ
jgi:hypothetical protein